MKYLKPSWRNLFVAVLASVAATIMLATVRADLPDEVAVCKGIADNGTRLSCFDALTLPPNPTSVVPTGSIEERTTGVQPKATPTASQQPLSGVTAFGAESVPKEIADQPKILKAKVLGSVRGIRKGLLIQLENGQQWRSVDDRDYDYEADSPEVTIDRNLIGTYWMAFPNSGIRIRARRIK